MITLEERPYQQRIISKTIDAFSNGSNSVLIESPPGSGKTFMGLSIAQKIIDNSIQFLNKQPNEVKFGWVAMRRNLLAQAKLENETKVGCSNIEFISMFEKKPPKVDVLIIDEAHHDAANSCANIHNVSQPSWVLGLSATPYRTDRMKLCFSKVIKDAGFHRLIQDGYLSRFNQWMLPEWDAATVCNVYLEDPKRWGKTVIFFLTINECKEAAAILKANGIPCEVVTGETDRFEQIDKFANGKVKVLLNVYVLSEGFDCDSMQSVFVRDSQRGPVIQMAGRVLRRHPNIPVTNVVQSTNTKYPFIRVARAENQYVMVDGKWRTVGASKMVEMMQKQMLGRIISTDVTLPKLLKDKRQFSGLNNADRAPGRRLRGGSTRW